MTMMSPAMNATLPQNIPQTTQLLLDMKNKGQLQSYVAQHKDDPGYASLLSLAMTINQTSDQAKALAAQPPQQTISNTALASLAPRHEALQMPVMPQSQTAPQMPQTAPQTAPQGQPPEMSGIAQAPAPNMQHMADGGIVGYAEGGNTYDASVYRRYAVAQAEKLGLDPRFVDGIFTTESNYNPNAKSPTGPVGIGQLTKSTARAYGIHAEDRKDGFKNIDASLAYMKDLQKKYDNDPQKMAVGYNQGETFLNDHLRNNNGQLVPANLGKQEPKNYLKKLSHYIPFNAATASELNEKQRNNQVPTDLSLSKGEEVVQPSAPTAPPTVPAGGLASLIPGQDVKAPAYVDTSTPMGKFADYLGVPEEYQRNINNTLNALGGFTAPVSGVAKGVGAVSKGLAPTAEAVAKAEALAKVANTPRLVAPTAEGISALSAESQATRAAAEQARRMRLLQQDQAAAKGAQQSVDAATQTANIANEAEKGLAQIAPNAKLNTIKLADSAKAIDLMHAAEQPQSPSNINTVQNAGVGSDTTASMGANSYDFKPDYSFNGYINANSAPSSNEAKPPSAPTTEGINPAAPSGQGLKPTGGRDWNDFLMNFGLGMMAGKSPYALQNIGEAGIGALKGAQEQEKQARDEELKRQEMAMMRDYYTGVVGAKNKELEMLGPHYLAQDEIARLNATKPRSDLEFAYNNPGALRTYQQMTQEKQNQAAIVEKMLVDPLFASQHPEYKPLLDNYMKSALRPNTVQNAAGNVRP